MQQQESDLWGYHVCNLKNETIPEKKNVYWLSSHQQDMFTTAETFKQLITEKDNGTKK